MNKTEKNSLGNIAYHWCRPLYTDIMSRLKKVQGKKKERAAVEDAVRAKEAADAELIGHESKLPEREWEKHSNAYWSTYCSTNISSS